MRRIGRPFSTASGRVLYPLGIDPEDIQIEDAARSLALTSRFYGHFRECHPYSVAEHSVRVAHLVSLHQPRHALWALLHDVPEMIVGDCSRPVKYLPMMQGYRMLERRIMDAVCVRFGLPLGMPPIVKFFDNVAVATEQRDLTRTPPELIEPYPKLRGRIVPMQPHEAEAMYLTYFRILTEKRNASNVA